MNGGKLNYVVVGAFVLAMAAALVVSVAVLMGRTGATDDYYTVYRNVTGIKFGTQVLYEGYPVGQVESVTPVPSEGGMGFRVDFGVAKDWRIPEDSVAVITAPRLLAAVTINISAGDSAAALSPGAMVRGREGADIFAAMSMLAGEVTELTRGSIRPLLASLNETVGTAGKILANDGAALSGELRALAETVNRRAPRIIDNLERFTESINATGDEVRKLASPKNREKIEEAIANLQKAGANVGNLTTRIDRLAGSMQGVVEDNETDIRRTVANLRYITESVARDIDSINQNLDGTARNMFEFSREIRQNPGVLLGGSRPRDDTRRR
jgi:phospholipid/cholesterol/gamma-HCH transport system substrate-binding protein